MNSPKEKGRPHSSTSHADLRSQSLFFSATLNTHGDNQQAYQLKKLMGKLAKRGNPELIATGDSQAEDAETGKKDSHLLPTGLELRQVMVVGDKEKEEFLYTFGKQFSGHTLVFFNSIRTG